MCSYNSWESVDSSGKGWKSSRSDLCVCCVRQSGARAVLWLFLSLALLSCSVVSDSLQPHGLYLAQILCAWGFPGKKTRVCCCFCLFSLVKVTQSCPTLCDPMDCSVLAILQVGILEWVAVPFSRGSSQPRNQTGVSCIAGRFFTNWATSEAPLA